MDAPATRVFPCPIPDIGSSSFVHPACLMRRIAGCRWSAWRRARGASISVWRARMRLEFALVFRSRLVGLFALALSSVFPAFSATPTSALRPQTEAELRKTSFSFSHSVPWLRQPPIYKRMWEPGTNLSSSRRAAA